MRSAYWAQYQREVASSLERLHIRTAVEEIMIGARAHHKVDVVARPLLAGVEQLWIVECKYWKSPVKKENVLTLLEIVKDVGADRGFVFSESGFQAGAIHAVGKTNVELTSIGEFEERAHGYLVSMQVEELHRGVVELREHAMSCETSEGLGAPSICTSDGDGNAVDYYRMLGFLSLNENNLDRHRRGCGRRAVWRMPEPSPERFNTWDEYYRAMKAALDEFEFAVQLLMRLNPTATCAVRCGDTGEIDT